METFAQKVARIAGEELEKALRKLAGDEPASDRSWSVSTGDLVPMRNAVGGGGRAAAEWTDAQVEELLDRLEGDEAAKVEGFLQFAYGRGFTVNPAIEARARLAKVTGIDPGADADFAAAAAQAPFIYRQLRARSATLEYVIGNVLAEGERCERMAKVSSGHMETHFAAQGRTNAAEIVAELARISANPRHVSAPRGARPEYVDRRPELREIVALKKEQGDMGAMRMFQDELNLEEAKALSREPSRVIEWGTGPVAIG